MKVLSTLGLATAVTLSSVLPALANHGISYEATQAPAASGQACSDRTERMAQGVVRRVNEQAGKITIRHERLKHLDMPAMTMEFAVMEPAVLENFKAGDKVKFVAEKIAGVITLVELEPSRRQC